MCHLFYGKNHTDFLANSTLCEAYFKKKNASKGKGQHRKKNKFTNNTQHRQLPFCLEGGGPRQTNTLTAPLETVKKQELQSQSRLGGSFFLPLSSSFQSPPIFLAHGPLYTSSRLKMWYLSDHPSIITSLLTCHKRFSPLKDLGDQIELPSKIQEYLPNLKVLKS